jgi:hypothetical protein
VTLRIRIANGFGRFLTVGLVVLLVWISGCTTTDVVGVETIDAQSLSIGEITTAYSADINEARRLQAQSHQVAEQVGRLVQSWLDEAGLLAGDDVIHIELDSFRLPVESRWASGAAKGNDYLGPSVTVLRNGSPQAEFHVEQTLGAGERSVAENYSANRAQENLIEAVAWSIALEVTPMHRREPIYMIGKREQIERAITELELCGELSYAEAAKFATLGKIEFKTASGAEARRTKWLFGFKPKPCWTEPAEQAR